MSDLVVVGFFLVPGLVCGGRDDLAAYGRPRQVVPGSLVFLRVSVRLMAGVNEVPSMSAGPTVI